MRRRIISLFIGAIEAQAGNTASPERRLSRRDYSRIDSELTRHFTFEVSANIYDLLAIRRSATSQYDWIVLRFRVAGNFVLITDLLFTVTHNDDLTRYAMDLDLTDYRRISSKPVFITLRRLYIFLKVTRYSNSDIGASRVLVLPRVSASQSKSQIRTVEHFTARFYQSSSVSYLSEEIK